MAFLTENQTPFSLSSVFMRSVMHNVDCYYYFCCEMASKTKSVHFLTYLKEQVPPAQTALKLGCLLAYLTSRPLLAEAKLHSCFRQFSDFTTSYLLQELLLLSGLKPFLICWRHVQSVKAIPRWSCSDTQRNQLKSHIGAAGASSLLCLPD